MNPLEVGAMVAAVAVGFFVRFGVDRAAKKQVARLQDRVSDRADGEAVSKGDDEAERIGERGIPGPIVSKVYEGDEVERDDHNCERIRAEIDPGLVSGERVLGGDANGPVSLGVDRSGGECSSPVGVEECCEHEHEKYLRCYFKRCGVEGQEGAPIRPLGGVVVCGAPNPTQDMTVEESEQDGREGGRNV